LAGWYIVDSSCSLRSAGRLCALRRLPRGRTSVGSDNACACAATAGAAGSESARKYLGKKQYARRYSAHSLLRRLRWSIHRPHTKLLLWNKLKRQQRRAPGLSQAKTRLQPTRAMEPLPQLLKHTLAACRARLWATRDPERSISVKSSICLWEPFRRVYLLPSLNPSGLLCAARNITSTDSVLLRT